MDVIHWLIIVVMFMIGFIGIVYPIIPSVLFILEGILLYGVFYSFELFYLDVLDHPNFIGTSNVLRRLSSEFSRCEKVRGSKAGIWGSTIGILVGPFVIPFLGIIIGPFLGSFIAELVIHKKNPVVAAKIGFGSVIGFVGSVVSKSIIQLFMVVYFLFVVL